MKGVPPLVNIQPAQVVNIQPAPTQTIDSLLHVPLQDRSGFIGTYRWQRLSRPVIVQYLSLPIGGDSIPTANVRR
jgi:hypothetical protein